MLDDTIGYVSSILLLINPLDLYLERNTIKVLVIFYALFLSVISYISLFPHINFFLTHDGLFSGAFAKFCSILLAIAVFLTFGRIIGEENGGIVLYIMIWCFSRFLEAFGILYGYSLITTNKEDRQYKLSFLLNAILGLVFLFATLVIFDADSKNINEYDWALLVVYFIAVVLAGYSFMIFLLSITPSLLFTTALLVAFYIGQFMPVKYITKELETTSGRELFFIGYYIVPLAIIISTARICFHLVNNWVTKKPK